MSKTPTDYLIKAKKLWRCHVCNDVHFGERPPVLCPTCGARMAFVEVDRDEVLKVIDERGGVLSSAEEVQRVWGAFGSSSAEYKLVDDKEIVAGLANGVMENMKSHGLRYCPCRMTTGDLVNDLKLICPCNFQIQKTYAEKGECWCGLFERRVTK